MANLYLYPKQKNQTFDIYAVFFPKYFFQHEKEDILIIMKTENELCIICFSFMTS